MKTRIAIVMLMLITAFSVTAQTGKSGHSEMRKTDSFHYINIVGEMKVKLIQSVEPMVVVEGNSFQIGSTVTMLKSDTLFVYQSNIRKSDGKVRVSIYADEIKFLDVKGKTTVDATGYNKEFGSVRTKEGAQVKLKTTACDNLLVPFGTPYAVAACYAKWTPVKDEKLVE